MERGSAQLGRRLPLLRGLPNFRDLGGIHCADGRVRRAQVFRAPALNTLLPEDAETLAALDPETIIDLRGPDEVQTAPMPALAARRLPMPIPPSAAHRLRQAMLAQRLSEATAHALMIDTYADFVLQHSHVFAALLRRLAEAARPVVFHCTAGKDRTGLAAALFLTACGAARPAIEADYLRTATLWSPDPGLAALVPEPAREALFGVRTAYLDAAFDALDRHHGSAQAFVRNALGDDAALLAFRDRYVETG
ncbi:MAG: tyrosine-protein phosphatase [Pseudomonadota bacterium]